MILIRPPSHPLNLIGRQGSQACEYHFLFRASFFFFIIFFIGPNCFIGFQACYVLFLKVAFCCGRSSLKTQTCGRVSQSIFIILLKILVQMTIKYLIFFFNNILTILDSLFFSSFYLNINFLSLPFSLSSPSVFFFFPAFLLPQINTHSNIKHTNQPLETQINSQPLKTQNQKTQINPKPLEPL